ncbi:MAG: hypothetical protein A2046_03875 [Bacteroidetes bacterium GWA2_30_7]|nr:MAG: hypothetical protein A2046_03875 [Bacteroidetes bacterium GWA2_30_7]
MNDIKKSLNSILYERTTSPFFGTLILSWILWNWKIIYLTIFISEEKIASNKIDYIINNFSETHHLITYPLLSTLILLTIIPFFSNGAFWLSLKFNKWKKDQKNIADKKQLLTIEQSIDLRELISKQEERFEKLLNNKNNDIKQLNLQLEEYKKSNFNSEPIVKEVPEVSQNELNDLSQKIKQSQYQVDEYNLLIKFIQNGTDVRDTQKISVNLLSTLEAYDIIQKQGTGVYKFTEKGKFFHRLMIK